MQRHERERDRMKLGLAQITEAPKRIANTGWGDADDIEQTAQVRPFYHQSATASCTLPSCAPRTDTPW